MANTRLAADGPASEQGNNSFWHTGTLSYGAAAEIDDMACPDERVAVDGRAEGDSVHRELRLLFDGIFGDGAA